MSEYAPDRERSVVVAQLPLRIQPELPLSKSSVIWTCGGPDRNSKLAPVEVSPKSSWTSTTRGRSAGQAPEIDGQVIINDGTAEAGEFVTVEVTEAHPYDLVGRRT